MIDEKARVLSNRQLMPGTYLLELEAPESARQAQPGQFAMVQVASQGGCMLRRPLSIHQAKGKSLSFLYSVSGKGTQLLSQCPEGQSLSILAPLGNGFRLPEIRTEILLVAGGIGIAPLFFLAEKAVSRGIRPKLLLGARSEECLYPGAYIPSGTEFVCATEDGSAGFTGRITGLFLSQLQGIGHVYACGPLDMYRAMNDLLLSWQKSHDHEKRDVQVSLEARMACGVGACYGCVIRTKNGTKKVCSDGPVFNIDEILWQEAVI